MEASGTANQGYDGGAHVTFHTGLVVVVALVLLLTTGADGYGNGGGGNGQGSINHWITRHQQLQVEVEVLVLLIPYYISKLHSVPEWDLVVVESAGAPQLTVLVRKWFCQLMVVVVELVQQMELSNR